MIISWYLKAAVRSRDNLPCAVLPLSLNMEQGDDSFEPNGYHGYWIGSLYRMLLSVSLSVNVLWSAGICVALEPPFWR